MAGLLELLGLTKKTETKPTPPRTGPDDWDEEGERKRVREELKTLQSDDLKKAGATEAELKELEEQIKAVEESLEDYIYMMPDAELDELKQLRERVRKQIEVREKKKQEEIEAEELRQAKEKYENRLKDLMPGYNDVHGKGSPFQKKRLEGALKQVTDLATDDPPDYASAVEVLRYVQTVVSVVGKDQVAKGVYEESLKDFMATKYNPIFKIADKEQQERISTELEKVTTVASGEDPNFVEVESMLELIEPLLEQIPLEIEAAKEEQQRLLEEKQRVKEQQTRANQSRLDEAIDDLDRYAKLTATVLPKLSERFRNSHTAAVKMKKENKVTDDSGPIQNLELGVKTVSFLELLAEYQPRYLAVFTPNPKGVVQKELETIYNSAITLASKAEFDEAGAKLYDDLDKKLQNAEGEPIYKNVLDEVKVEYERIESDSDATMPEDDMRKAYAGAQQLGDKEGKFGPAIKLLRGILALVPKVDSYTNKFKLVKPSYQDSQKSQATSAQKKAITAALTVAQDRVKKGDPADGMKKLDDLTQKIKDVETATERRTKSSKCPSIVPKAPGKGMEKLDDAKTLLEDGGMTAENVMKMIPKGTNNTWRPNKSRFDKGFQYEWEGPDKIKYHVHGHTRDKNHTTGNSGTGAVVRIRVGDNWLKSDGTLTNSLYDDDAHIPMY